MPDIDIHARHGLAPAEAQDMADELAQDLARRFDIDYGWDGDHIVFRRPGVDGLIEVAPEHLHVQARLGLLLAFLKPLIEDEIRNYLSSHFGCRFD